MENVEYWKQRALAAEAAIKEVDRIYEESCYPDDIVSGLSNWQDEHEKARDYASGKV